MKRGLYMLTINQVPVVTGTLVKCSKALKMEKRYGQYVFPPVFRIEKVGDWRKRK